MALTAFQRVVIRLLASRRIDSAFRFFPLVRHEEFGLVLHPFDLATNKVLALVGRLEVRDFVGGEADLKRALDAEGLRFHAGSIHGALPRIR